METNKITNHYFIRDGDGRCGFTWHTHGSGTERERCGGAEDRHIPDPAVDVDD